jgi:hypothetical protein
MTRTRIETIDHNRVDIAFDTEGYDGVRRRRLSLWAPEGGGYVLDMISGNQPCERFERLGSTLLWSGREPLATMIRAEYRRMRAAEEREARRF